MSERLNDDEDLQAREPGDHSVISDKVRNPMNPPGRKVWLDDERKEPIGWFRAKTCDECIDMLKRGDVAELSLDHDLADVHYAQCEASTYGCADPYVGAEKTGYHVVLWMAENNVWPPVLRIHSMSPAGRERMEATIRRYAPGDTVLHMMRGGAHPPE